MCVCACVCVCVCLFKLKRWCVEHPCCVTQTRAIRYVLLFEGLLEPDEIGLNMRLIIVFVKDCMHHTHIAFYTPRVYIHIAADWVTLLTPRSKRKKTYLKACFKFRGNMSFNLETAAKSSVGGGLCLRFWLLQLQIATTAR